MIPLIENEVVHKKKWIDEKDFIDMLVLAQSSPGPLAVNVSVFVGYKIKGLIGSIVATLGAILTSFITLLIIAIYFANLKNNNIIIEKAFMGIRPAVVALIVSPIIRMIKKLNMSKKMTIIPIITIILVVLFKVNPMYIIISSILFGLIYKGGDGS